MYIKLVVFDLDGVLTTTSREHFLAWSTLAKHLGHTLSPHVYDDIKGISRMASLDVVLRDIGMTERFSESEKRELAEQKNAIYVDMISKFDETNLATGALELFDLLKSKKVKIALGSVSKNACMLLNSMKIFNMFDYIVNPALVKNAKPAPDIFIEAARYFSLNVERCVGIEDAASGIRAIKSAGMHAVGIGHKGYLQDADIVYEDLKSVDMYYIDKQIAVKKKRHRKFS